VQAFLALPAEAAKSARLTIGGQGPELAHLQKLAAGHTGIRFAGFIPEPEKAAYLQAADLAVFPSTGGESFGISLVEAMAAGCAVLAGDNPGYRSVMHATPEALVDPAHTQTFAAAMARYISDDMACDELRAAQADVVRSFDVETVGPQTVAWYEQAIARRASVGH
jgi:phosphatidyl-myo-inositol alpha-mannosyltransferase